MSKQTSILPGLPIVREEETGTPIKYGDSKVTFPVANDRTVDIDAAFFSGKNTLRLRHIKQCLKLAGKANTGADGVENRRWFNKEVRDAYHKALRFANSDAMRNGTPVSMGLTKRTASKTGRKVLTTRFSYELELVAATPKVLEAKAAKQSAKRAKRQARKGLVQLANKLDNAVSAPLRGTTPVETPTVEATE